MHYDFTIARGHFTTTQDSAARHTYQCSPPHQRGSWIQKREVAAEKGGWKWSAQSCTTLLLWLPPTTRPAAIESTHKHQNLLQKCPFWILLEWGINSLLVWERERVLELEREPDCSDPDGSNHRQGEDLERRQQDTCARSRNVA